MLGLKELLKFTPKQHFHSKDEFWEVTWLKKNTELEAPEGRKTTHLIGIYYAQGYVRGFTCAI